MDLEFELNLEKFCDVVIEVGLNLQPGQRLLMIDPKLELAPLVRLIAGKAYKRGTKFVDVMWSDDQLTLTRFQNAPRDSFEEVSNWWIDGILGVIEEGGATINFSSVDPDLLVDQDPLAVGTAQMALVKRSRQIGDLRTRNSTNWLIIAPPIGSWSKKIFPDLTMEEANAKFWDITFEICRVKLEDPVAAWKEHIKQLEARCDYMNRKRYASLKYSAPGTDLVVGLPREHIWIGGESTSQSGMRFTPNLPTEEIFTLPHRNKVDGYFTATRPVSVGGFAIEDIRMTLSDGLITEASASHGEEIMLRLLQMDEGASRLGEVALVPHSSPISQVDLLFHNILLDENAACHLAVGSAYKPCVTDGESMSDEEFTSIGGNSSNLHGDIMIGSNELDVDGIGDDNKLEPIMRGGEWAFEV